MTGDARAGHVNLRIINCSPSVGGPPRRAPRPLPREARSMPYLQPFSYVVVFCVSFLSMYGVTLHVCLRCVWGAVWLPWPDAGASHCCSSPVPLGLQWGLPQQCSQPRARPASAQRWWQGRFAQDLLALCAWPCGGVFPMGEFVGV